MKILWELQAQNHIDLFFSDESGFQLTPNLPYGWQAKGVYVRMLPRKGKRLNVFALLSSKNQLHAYTTQETMDAAYIIACLDDFASKLSKPTVVVMDNAPIHQAKVVLERRNAWEEQNLFIFFLPKYAPHLNRIETLWRKIKYEWLRPKDYKSWSTFCNAVKNILTAFGSKNYNILFSEPYYIL